MNKFCLIGETLKHSYSAAIHKAFNKYSYELKEIKREELQDFVKSRAYDGFNVTIPYKRDIMQYLDYVDDVSAKIGAVNTVVYGKDGKSRGYNTDILGMKRLTNDSGIILKGKKVLILGSGGTAHTAKYLCESENAKEIIIVSRSGEVNYDNIVDHKDADVIINTTPVGMYPKVHFSPIDLGVFTNLSGVIDVIYNPENTVLVSNAKARNIKAVGGSVMLAAQAKYAMDLFLGKTFDDSYVQIALEAIRKENE